MFDKEYMMEDEHGFYIYREARKIPITINRIDELLQFVSDYVNTRNKVIKKYKTEGKDITSLVADRDYALYILGLGEKPERQAKVIL